MSSSSSSSSYSSGETLTLIPGLPNDLAALILASIPFSHHARLKPTSKSWHAFLSSRSLFLLRRRLHLPLRRHLLCLFPADPSITSPYLFDPTTLAWAPLPPLPCSPHFYGLSNFVPVSVGPHLYVLGGSRFDTRSYPLGHPTPSSAVHRLDLSSPHPLSWSRLPDMLSPRGSFACAPINHFSDGEEAIVVAGGGSRHTIFPSEGSRMSSAERFDVGRGDWRVVEGLPRYRAGCVGFFLRPEEKDDEDEFWVMGGYGDYRTVSGVVPADVYYRDAVVLGLRSGKWREIGDMWEAGERRKLGAVVVLDGEDAEGQQIFMLDRNDIFRYDIASNRWLKESSLRRKIPVDVSSGFVAMDGELYVLTSTMPCSDVPDTRRVPKKRMTLEIQVYHPKKRKWRFLTTNPPFHHPLDFKIAVSCTVRL